MSGIDDLLANARRRADKAGSGPPSAHPRKRIAIVACMDARLDVYRLLDLEEGDAHVIRNAGGVVTDDVIRSLAISQRLLGTEEVMLIHHTGCGMLSINDDEFRRQIQQETGIRPPWAAEAFEDLEDDVRQSIARIRASPFIPNTQTVRGFVHDIASRRVNEVTLRQTQT